MPWALDDLASGSGGVWPPWPVVLCVALAAVWVVSLLVVLVCCQGRSGEGEAGDVEAQPLDDLEAGVAVEPSIGGLRRRPRRGPWWR